jgi:general secretion pathway protein I
MRRAGFTLLEVLVATALMGIAVAGLLSALSTSLANAARVAEHDRAAALARRKMDELLAEKRLPMLQPMEGQFEPATAGGALAGWKAVVTPFEAQRGQGLTIIQRIALEVWWMRGGRRQAVQVDAYRMADVLPAEAAQAAAALQAPFAGVAP